MLQLFKQDDSWSYGKIRERFTIGLWQLFLNQFLSRWNIERLGEVCSLFFYYYYFCTTCLWSSLYFPFYIPSCLDLGLSLVGVDAWVTQIVDFHWLMIVEDDYLLMLGIYRFIGFLSLFFKSLWLSYGFISLSLSLSLSFHKD